MTKHHLIYWLLLFCEASERSCLDLNWDCFVDEEYWRKLGLSPPDWVIPALREKLGEYREMEGGA